MKFLAFVRGCGGAVVNQIAQYGKSKDLVKRVGKFVRTMTQTAAFGDTHSGQ
jgi:hypothetical protein